MKMPAPMTMPTQIDTACRSLNDRSGTAGANGGLNMGAGSRPPILPPLRRFDHRAVLAMLHKLGARVVCVDDSRQPLALQAARRLAFRVSRAQW
jgi:hypothetical protein